MIFEGNSLTVKALEDGIVELNFDLQGESVNKFNRATVQELYDAAQAASKESGVKGMIVTSSKKVFIVGADITEFSEIFASSEEEIANWAIEANKSFSAIEDLPFPVGTELTDSEIDVLLKYNMHDVLKTLDFFNISLNAIRFRDELSKKYKRDFTNHNDTKIGKDYFIIKF